MAEMERRLRSGRGGIIRALDITRPIGDGIRMLDIAAVRANLQHLADEHGDTLQSLSVLLGRNHAYLQQFVQRGSPKVLAEDDRLMLAKHFRVDERLLGARDPWTPGDDV